MKLITNKTNTDVKNIMSNYRQSAVMPVLIADNIFKVTARNISKLPVVDGDNNEINKELIKPFLRGLKCSPQSYDFIVNLIQNIEENGDVKKRLRRVVETENLKAFAGEVFFCKTTTENSQVFSEEYFTCKITPDDFTPFLKQCNGRTIRRTIRRQLLSQLNSEFIISETEEKIIKFRPYYMFVHTTDKKSGNWIAKIMLAGSIFRGFITGDHGPKGYVRIPRYLFPKVTHADKHHLESYNPIYRAIVYANVNNRNRKEKIYAKLPEFLESVFPEYLNKNNSLKVGLEKCEDSLNEALETISKKVIKEELLLNHLVFSKKNNEAILYYRLPRWA